MSTKKSEFKMNAPQYGEHGGGTQPAIYLDSKTGEKKPFKKTKWAKLAKLKKVVNSLAKGGQS